MRVVAAPDKLRGTATAAEVAAAVGRAAWDVGWDCDEVPVSDGGEGLLEALGGANRTTTVTGPLGDPVRAEWQYRGNRAVLEMARASGIGLVAENDAVAASTAGTGELVSAAVDAGCKRIIVGLGGSATTDGGLGALRALEPLARLKAIDIRVACDVRTTFVDAAEVFAPQKGATPKQVELLRRRLERLAQMYLQTYGVDVRAIPGSGAAGGLAGGLACAGAKIVGGFDLVADELDLADRVEGADLVVTGEGYLDAQSFEGKVVGGVLDLALAAGVPVLAVVGEVEPGLALPDGLEVVSLLDRFGADRAHAATTTCIVDVVREALAAR